MREQLIIERQRSQSAAQEAGSVLAAENARLRKEQQRLQTRLEFTVWKTMLRCKTNFADLSELL